MGREYKRKSDGIPDDLPEDGPLILGDLDFICPDEVKRNPVAARKWREVIAIFKEAGLAVVSSTDSGIIGRYCTMYSDYLELVERREQLAVYELPEEDEQELLAMTEHEYGREKAKRIWRLVEYVTAMKGLIELDRAINAKQKVVLDIEERIFLTPASKSKKLKNTKKAEDADPLAKKGFDV